MKKIVISPDSLKGTLSAVEYCNITEKAINDAFESLGNHNKCEIIKIPLADGGEGSADALGCEIIRLQNITDSNFNKIESYYGVYNKDTVIIEVAACASLPSTKIKNPEITTTYGVGEIFNAAYNAGYRKYIFALGGSSTNDMGCGFAAAAGARFYNQNKELFIPTGGNLNEIYDMELTSLKDKTDNCDIIAMCDVTNELYGKNGAAYIFAPQKGADSEMVVRLDNNLKYLADLIYSKYNFDVSNIKGGGAAGGFCAGLVFFTNADCKSGIDTILKITDYEALIENADFVITGEGKFDSQSINGKVISGVTRVCKRKSIPVVIVCGSSDDCEINYDKYNIKSVFSVHRKAQPLEEALKRNSEDLYTTIYNLIRFRYF